MYAYVSFPHRPGFLYALAGVTLAQPLLGLVINNRSQARYKAYTLIFPEFCIFIYAFKFTQADACASTGKSL